MLLANENCHLHGLQPHYNGKCGVCFSIEAEKRKKDFFAPVEGKTTQEQVDWLKEIIYNHMNNHPSSFMSDMIGMG